MPRRDPQPQIPGFLSCSHLRHNFRHPPDSNVYLCASAPGHCQAACTAVIGRPSEPPAPPPPSPPPSPRTLQGSPAEQTGSNGANGWRVQADAAHIVLSAMAERRGLGRGGDRELAESAWRFLSALRPWSKRIMRQRDILLSAFSSYLEKGSFEGTDAAARIQREAPAHDGALSDSVVEAPPTPIPWQLWPALHLLALRALQRARAAARAEEDEAAAKMDGRGAMTESLLRDKRRRLLGTSKQYARTKRIGNTPNVYWRAVDREVLRAHSSWENLPLPGALTIKSARDLRWLRQDCEAWFQARSLVQVNASTVWMALGFGESYSARRLFVPSSSGMRSHDHALHAYYQMLDPSPYAARRRKEDENDVIKQVYLRFGSVHEAGALLSLIGWENGVFSDSAQRCRRSRNPEGKFSEMMRLQEAGLYILERQDIPDGYNIDFDDVPVIAASPDALARRRRRDDFGAWEVQGSEVVEVKCRVPFIPLDGGARWLFQLIEPKRSLPAQQYAQVQFQMLCAGQHVRRAMLASYAVLNGMAVLEVERNDAWLAAALQVLADFQTAFVYQDTPPPPDFFGDRPEYAAFIELTRDSMQAATLLANIPVDEVEACLLPHDSRQQEAYDRWRSEIFVRDLTGGSLSENEVS